MRSTCGAKTRDGGTCGQPGLPPSGRCHYHGGAPGSGRPPIHGRYSRLKGIFGERWDDFFLDPAKWRFDGDVTLFLLREAELAARLDACDTPDFRETALELFRQLRNASAEEAPAVLKELHRHLKEGASRDEAWETLLKNAERRTDVTKKAVETVTKAENSFTRQEVRLLLASMVEIIREELGEVIGARVARRFAVEILGRVGEPRSGSALALGDGSGSGGA